LEHPVDICLSVMTVSPAEMAEPIEMPFTMSTRMGPPTNHILDWATYGRHLAKMIQR